jgi:hypothetical protein
MTTYSVCSAAALAVLLSGTAALAQTMPQSDAPARLATTPADTIAAAAQSSPEIHAGVRIVRISQVKGEVKLDRNASEDGTQTFENAFTNLPIIQGATLKTQSGVAEVELEDNSTLRLTPDTTIQFTELRRDASGFTSSTVRVVEGTLFVSLAPNRGNHFTLTSTEGAFVVAPDSRVHFHEGSPQGTSKTTVAVLDGSVQAQAGSTITTAGKKTTLEYDPANQGAAPILVSHLEKTEFDNWDKQSADYHKRYMNYSKFGSGYGGTGSPVYGISDMNYYGAFSGAGGCGSMWRPYLASAAWDPYSNGLMAYYPGAGYSWVSPYPWGWMPYHSGSWVNCPGTGWGWQPGGAFNGLANANPAILRKHLISPPAPPTKTGHPHLLAVSTQPLLTSGFADKNTFVFSKDSAGLGVPRATFGKLSGTSQYALKYGAVSTPAYNSSVSGPSRTAQSGSHSVSFARAGSNPSMGSSSSSRGSTSSGFSSASSTSGSFASSMSASSAGAHGGGASAGGGGGAHH